ncbi:MAG TPA: PxKF domain-containing protein [Terriglobales bacterium]|nr:PxKF domain-containing protein [Terriglobales bacterium]
MRNATPTHRFAGACLLLVFLIIAAPSAMATHLRGESISWRHVGATGTTVEFTFQYSQRWTYPNGPGTCGGTACPPVGTVNTLTGFNQNASAVFNFGDGTTANPTGTVTSVNASEDWFTATFVFQHVYSSAGPFTAYFWDFNRISTLEIGHDQPEYLWTIVNPTYVNGSPVASLPAFIAVPLQNTTSFNLGAAVSDIDPNVHLVYRLATFTEQFGPLSLGSPSSVSCPSGLLTTNTQPPGLTIASTTGAVIWDTTQIHPAFNGTGDCGYPFPAANQLWTTQVVVEARDATNVLKASIVIDVILKFVNPVGALPTLTLNPVGPQTIQAGTPVSFIATGNSSNAGAKITLNASGVPAGATASNLNATLTPPVASTFSWTPTTSQTGTFVVTYTATDNNLQQVTQSKTIVVSANPPTATCSPAINIPYNQSATVSANVFDPNNELLNVAFAVDVTPAQTFNNVTAFPTAATESITQTYGAVGLHIVKVTATDPHGVTASCTTAVTVTKADQGIDFAALSNATYGDADFNVNATATSGLAVSFAASGNCTISGNTVHLTGAGSCSLTASQLGDSNYNPASDVTRTFSIGQASSTATVTCPASVGYNGAAQTPCTAMVTGFGGLNQSATVNYIGNTNAGTATASASFAGDADHSPSSNSTTFEIAPAQLTVTAGSYSGVYDGAAHALSACAVSANFDGLTCTNNPIGPVGPDVGGTAVTPVISGSTSNYAVTVNNGTWSITPLAVTVTGGSYSGVYDGASHAPSACSSSYAGVTCSNSPASVGPDVGSGAINPIAAVASGIPADYTITSANGAWSITPLAVTVTGGSYSGVYDGASHAPSACSSSYAGVTCSNSPASVGPDVGSGAINPIGAVASGIPADYTITSANGAWSITPLAVTVTGGSYSGVYDGASHAPSACTSSYAGVTCSNSPASVGPSAGSGAVVPLASIATGIPADYSLAVTNGAWSITQAASVTTVTCPANVTYTGSGQTPCTAVATGAGGLNQPLAVSYSNNINPGTATASAAFAGDTNHTASNGSAHFQIGPAPSTTTVTCNPTSVTYTGAAQTPCTATATGVGGLNQAVPVTYSNNVNAGTATANASFSGDSTHSPSSGSATFTIAQAPSMVIITCPASVTYTGSAQTPCAATVTGAGGLNQSVAVTYSNNVVGTATANASYAGDANHTGSTASTTFKILYSTGACNGGPGHTILPPINADGTTVRHQGSTVPAKFNVCDAQGNLVGTPGTVASFYLVSIIAGTTTTSVQEAPISTPPDTVFRWTGSQWIFNISTKNLAANATYVYQIGLNDGSIIQFQYGLE